MILHTDGHFALRGGDLDLWLATCLNLPDGWRNDVYIKAALLGRKDVIECLASTFNEPHRHNDALCAALVYEQFECADWIEQHTPIDMYFVEHIFSQAVSFDFETLGGSLVNNDKPFFENWVEHQEFEKCRAQKKVIEKHLNPSNIVHPNRKI